METSTPIIDWQQHAQMGGDTSMSKELLTLFLQQLPELEDKFQQAFTAQDIESLHATLHRLQGACAYCGLPRLREIVASKDSNLRKGQMLTQTDYEQLSQEILLIKEELKKHGLC